MLLLLLCLSIHCVGGGGVKTPAWWASLQCRARCGVCLLLLLPPLVLALHLLLPLWLLLLLLHARRGVR